MNKPCPYQMASKAAKDVINMAINEIHSGKKEKLKLIWLELNGCSGNIISLLDGSNPGFEYMLFSMAETIFINSISVLEGSYAMEQLFNAENQNFVLACEGAVSIKENGIYNFIGNYKGRYITGLEAVSILGRRASHIIAVGTCASGGGISSARPNPTQCVNVGSVVEKNVINLPGCPCHPDWFLGTLANIILYGNPDLDNFNRPLMFYGFTIHDRCTRRSYFDAGIFAEKLGDPECMFQLGCSGPMTYADCPVRKWNQYVNWPIGSGSNCIGCARLEFPDASEPFVTFTGR